MIQTTIYQKLSPLWTSFLNKTYRILWHQTLNKYIRYYELPHKTYNFDVYPLNMDKVYTQSTYESVGITRYSSYLEDVIVSEVWEAQQLSSRIGFFYELKRFFDKALDEDEYLIWYPKDKTDKAFIIEITNLFMGASDRLSVNPVHDKIVKDFSWSKEIIQFEFRVLRNYIPPNFSLEIEDI